MFKVFLGRPIGIAELCIGKIWVETKELVVVRSHGRIVSVCLQKKGTKYLIYDFLKKIH